MVHKILVPDSTSYTLLAGKHKFKIYNVFVIALIFFLGFTCIGLLGYNFYKTAIADQEKHNNVKVPNWMQWIWKHNSTNNSTNYPPPIKPIEQNYLVCYYTVPGSNSTKKLHPNFIDPKLCSHIIVGFAGVTNCSIQLAEGDWAIYRQMVSLKKQEPKLKVMVSVGGAGMDDRGFSEMVSNHSNRKIFIKSVLNLTKTLNLDGLDLDWEFPVWAGVGKNKGEHQKVNFIQLTYELRKEFDHSGQKLILSAAVAALQAIVDESYYVPELSAHIDFINLMSYDYHFYIWYYPVTHLNSPLFPRLVETGYLTSLNVNFSAHYWISKGMPREKIVIGIPTYGHTYKLYNIANHGIQAPARGFGDKGKQGFVDYPEVCKFLDNGAVRVFANDSRVPYTYKDYEWISYDDATSIKHKAQWIKSNGFKGAMVFSLNADDWNSTCSSNQKFPLVHAVKKILKI